MATNAKPSFATISIISVAMHFSLFIFLFLGYFLTMQLQTDPGSADYQNQMTTSANSNLYPIFATIALVNATLCAALPAILGKKKIASPENETFDGSLKTKRSLFLDFNNVDEEVMRLTLIRFALAESIAVIGFVNTILTKNFMPMLPFVIVALSLQIAFGPFVGRMMSAKRPEEM